MTDGEKMIWAAKFASCDLRNGVENAVVDAAAAVVAARIVFEKSTDDWCKEGQPYTFLKEMLND
jgi:hypothetical protein